MPLKITREDVVGAWMLTWHIIRPTFAQPRFVWGPRFIAFFVKVDGLDEEFSFEEGSTDDWDPRWGTPDKYRGYARGKCDLARRYGQPTGYVVNQFGPILRPDDPPYAGGVCLLADGTKIGVGASGVEEWADEFLAHVLAGAIVAQARIRLGEPAMREEVATEAQAKRT